MGGRGGPKRGSIAIPVSLNSRIRDAYASLLQDPDEGVFLSKLKSQLSNIPSGELDQALRDLDRTREAVLIPEAQQGILSAKDRDAAIRIGGEDKHILRFNRRR